MHKTSNANSMNLTWRTFVTVESPKSIRLLNRQNVLKEDSFGKWQIAISISLPASAWHAHDLYGAVESGGDISGCSR